MHGLISSSIIINIPSDWQKKKHYSLGKYIKDPSKTNRPYGILATQLGHEFLCYATYLAGESTCWHGSQGVSAVTDLVLAGGCHISGAG